MRIRGLACCLLVLIACIGAGSQAPPAPTQQPQKPGMSSGIAAGVLLSLIFALMTLGLAVNQVATGLALTILGIGLSGLIGAGFRCPPFSLS